MTESDLDSGTSDGEVDVVIPWRPQPHRLDAFNRVMQWWQEEGFSVILADSDPALPFNLSQARNNGVRQASGDIVVIADADTIPDRAALDRAVRRARHEIVVYPFDKYVYLGEEVNPLDRSIPLDQLPREREFLHSYGGLMVVRRDVYWAVGGHDEGFRQWGYEDTAFQLAAECLYQTERITGTVYAFNHDAPRDMSSDNPGRARVQLYRWARRDPAVMKELIRR